MYFQTRFVTILLADMTSPLLGPILDIHSLMQVYINGLHISDIGITPPCYSRIFLDPEIDRKIVVTQNLVPSSLYLVESIQKIVDNGRKYGKIPVFSSRGDGKQLENREQGH